MSTTCTFSDGTSDNVTATVTYTGNNDQAVMTGYTVQGGNPKYPSGSPENMDLTVMVVNGQLMSASAFTKGSLEQAFAAAVGGGAGGNNFQWMDKSGDNVSSDNCNLSCA